ncbi:MAG: hypothetical protein ACR65U_05480 [Methylocystis sp.]
MSGTHQGYHYGNLIDIHDNVVNASGRTQGVGLNFHGDGATRVGERDAFGVWTTVESDPPSGFNPYISVFSVIQGNVPVSSRVGVWGGNFNAQLLRGATGYTGIYGAEFDVTAYAGSSVQGKYGISIVQGSGDSVHGAIRDAAIAVYNPVNTTGWNNIIALDNLSGGSPISASGCIICTKGPLAFAKGVDLSSSALSGNFLTGPRGNFTVSAAGDVGGRSYKAPTYIVSGAAPPNSGTCAIDAQAGGNTAGVFRADGACAGGTVTLSFAVPAPQGWVCDAHDMTTPANAINETGSTPSTVTFVAKMANLDQVAFKCVAF